MKTIIKLALASALAMSLAACQSAPTKTAADADMAIKAAQATNNKAKSVYAEWRDTGDLLKDAAEAQKKGDFDKAVKLANKAGKQAENALAQYESQKNVKPRL
ncbi:MAG: SoxXA-binding protein [Gammaproteobacteria bacterium]|nr:SoxXA-binding protein [Gammaproteobacteria bacterium]MCW8987660.1 SoxXA-binding protein [Gammaproteobacteria bacterium]